MVLIMHLTLLLASIITILMDVFLLSHLQPSLYQFFRRNLNLH